jgi:hypothetical protein
MVWQYSATGVYTHPQLGKVFEHRIGLRVSRWYRRDNRGLVYGPFITAAHAREAAEYRLPPSVARLTRVSREHWTERAREALYKTHTFDGAQELLDGLGCPVPFWAACQAYDVLPSSFRLRVAL